MALVSSVQLSVTEVTYSSISLIWTIRKTPDSYRLRITKHGDSTTPGKEQVLPATILAFEITHLSPGVLYQIQIAPIVNQRQLSWSKVLIVQTKSHPDYQLLVRSERLLKERCGEAREIVMGRRARDWQDFTMSSFKFARPKSHRDTRVRRMMVLSSAFEVHAEEGYLEGDDYFQGPLYKDNA